MKATTYNKNGEKIGEVDLPDRIFGLKLNPALLHQAVVAQLSNMRKVIAHTKDRGEVRGGGRKPWRQKGTGRARHGSRRSPIWKGGGVAFGPTAERNFKKKINKKMNQKAILMAMSGKAASSEIFVLDELELDEAKPSTKKMAAIIDKFAPSGESVLMIISKNNETVRKSGNNIPGFKVINLNNINVLDLLNYKYLILMKKTIEELKSRYIKDVESRQS